MGIHYMVNVKNINIFLKFLIPFSSLYIHENTIQTEIHLLLKTSLHFSLRKASSELMKNADVCNCILLKFLAVVVMFCALAAVEVLTCS